MVILNDSKIYPNFDSFLTANRKLTFGPAEIFLCTGGSVLWISCHENIPWIFSHKRIDQREKVVII